MRTTFQISLPARLAQMLTACMLGAAMALAAGGAGAQTSSAAALRARYAEMGQQLASSQFKRPLDVMSVESPTHLKADIYALVEHPFAVVREALVDPEHWCDVLILHLNTKYCRTEKTPGATLIELRVGKKYNQPVEDAYRLEFLYRAALSTPEFFDVGLVAKTGPLGTSDYRIQLEAVSVPGGKTFLHFTYSYAYNFVARLAMQGYLATLGRGKVGFTSLGTQADGQPDYIGGVRGVVERNSMRYYLAIEAYIGSMLAPAPEQLQVRLQSWFDFTERYPRQLHEIDRTTYLDMKRIEYQRMQKAP